MPGPACFNEIPAIMLFDPLAESLGAGEAGILRYGYFGAVGLAGRSRPTVASANWSTSRVLTCLYPKATPVRSNSPVEFSHASASGVTPWLR